MLVRAPSVRLLLLALLVTACDTHPAATTPPTAGSPFARSASRVRASTGAPKPAALATSQLSTFTPALDARIAQAPASTDADFEAFCQQPDTTLATTREGGLAWAPWSRGSRYNGARNYGKLQNTVYQYTLQGPHKMFVF